MTENIPKMKFEITTWTVIKISLAILLLFFLYYIRDVVLMFFVVLVLSSAFDPYVDWLQKRGVPRSLGLLSIYLVALGVIIVAISLLIPPIISQFKELANNFPYYWHSLTQGYSHLQVYFKQFGLGVDLQNIVSGLQQNLTSSAGGVFGSLVSLMGGIFTAIIILVLTFYLTVEENAIKKLIKLLASPARQDYYISVYSKIQSKLGYWLRGQVILAIIIGLLAYIGLLILGVEYPLVLALVAGVTEFIPYLGPILGAIPAVFIAFFQSPILALLVIVIYYIIQWLENNIIVPKVMQKMTGANPIIVMLAIIVGAKMAGIWGVVLAVPVATIIKIIFVEVFARKEEEV